jgi:hypothetical protein
VAAAAAFPVERLTAGSGRKFTGILVEGWVMEGGAGSGLFSCPGTRVEETLIGITVSMGPVASLIGVNGFVDGDPVTVSRVTITMVELGICDASVVPLFATEGTKAGDFVAPKDPVFAFDLS